MQAGDRHLTTISPTIYTPLYGLSHLHQILDIEVAISVHRIDSGVQGTRDAVLSRALKPLRLRCHYRRTPGKRICPTWRIPMLQPQYREGRCLRSCNVRTIFTCYKALQSGLRLDWVRPYLCSQPSVVFRPTNTMATVCQTFLYLLIIPLDVCSFEKSISLIPGSRTFILLCP